jgi:hypothetical protein
MAEAHTLCEGQAQGAIAMTETSESELGTLHVAAKAIDSDALRACDISSAFDKRLRVEGSVSSRDLEDNARAIAEKAGYFVVVDNSCDDWDYAAAAHHLLNRFHTLRAAFPRLC